ncbi:AhpC/TSA antioxidant enzyme-domain-containing protein [Auriculariales sp. MPI-PUGE-AT-0066]|nr:AhpC/TSA antioxidant enzyme-domain-containing protein [Auriculariales sp. MPI-PUGE-AT-0066]
MIVSPAAPHDALLTEKDFDAVAGLSVLDQDGNSHLFSSLFAQQRTVIVLIRHFWCGACQSYVEELAQIPQTTLEKAGVRLVIIGCGEPVRIREYKEVTGFSGDIYCDPTDKKTQASQLYTALGAGCSFATSDTRPSYIKKNFWSLTFKSAWAGPLKHLTQIGSQGRWDQNGGEFVLGPGNVCSYAWRMRNTNDHSPVADLMRHAGVEFDSSQ